MKQRQRVLWSVACAAMLSLLPLGAFAETAAAYAERISSLIEPAKLATLGKRGANPRVQKYVAQLAEARRDGNEPSNVVVQAVAMAGIRGDAATLTTAAMLRNLTIADRLGCLDAAGLKE